MSRTTIPKRKTNKYSPIIIRCIKRKWFWLKAEITKRLQVEAENRIINQDGTFVCVCAPFKWGVENVIKGTLLSALLYLSLSLV